MTQISEDISDLSDRLLEYYQSFENRLNSVNDKLLLIDSKYQKNIAEKAELYEKLNLILDNLPAGVIVINSQGIIIKINKVIADIFPIDLSGLSWSEVVEEFYEKSLDDGDILLNIGKIISITTMPLQTSNEQIILLQDVTKLRIEREVNLKKNRVTILEQMASSLAHQIKTPLASALMCVSELSHMLENEEEKVYLEKAKAKLKNIVVLSDEILGASKEGVKKKDLVTVSEIANLIREYTLCLEEKYKRNLKIQVCKSVDEGLCVKLYKLSFISAVINIIENGFESLDKSGFVTAKLYSNDGDSLVIEVMDSGEGLPKYLSEDDVFKPFISTKKNGSGLGLYIAKNIIESSSGSIKAELNEFGGTTFIIKIGFCNAQ